MGFWDSDGAGGNIQGGYSGQGGGYSTGGGYEAGQGSGRGGGRGGGYSDVNPEGAASDPFAYTKGSLLTPWEGKFDGSGFGGGGSGVADFKAHEFGDFNYRAARPDGFDERYNDPGNFQYADYQQPGAFQAPTAADMEQDPGYKFRMDQGQKALLASKAAQGVLKTGGTAKALTSYGQGVGSQEYDKVYGRKFGEYNKADEQGRFTYGTNRSNNAENFDRNVKNQQTGYSMRQGAWKDNAAVALDASRHGYDVAQGTYDRNYSKSRQGYDDERQHANSVAAAGAASANQAYGRAMNEYTMGRDEFWQNQDRQYAMLDREDARADREDSQAYDRAWQYGNAQSGYDTDRGNAQASGRVGSSNAWQGALSGIGQAATDGMATYGYYRGGGGGGGQQPPPRGGQYSGVPRDQYEQA